MNKYLILVIILLIVTLTYTFQNDKGMFLFILLLISVGMFLGNLVQTEVSLVRNKVDTAITNAQNAIGNFF